MGTLVAVFAGFSQKVLIEVNSDLAIDHGLFLQLLQVALCTFKIFMFTIHHVARLCIVVKIDGGFPCRFRMATLTTVQVRKAFRFMLQKPMEILVATQTLLMET